METGPADAVRDYLKGQRDRICDEICAYPTPIPACDVHFNRLLEERTGIFDALRRLDCLHDDDRSIADFVQTSPAIDVEHKAQLAALLAGVRDRLSD
jgi:hypothetical protein